MSEYQYYEFLAIDKPLSSAQQKELRSFSTRAEITSTRFTNEYHWGDFRGDPDRMMAQYFDAMVYVTNWGTHRFMLRLPKGAVDVAAWKTYCTGSGLRCKKTPHHVILDFQFDSEDSEFLEDAEDWLPSLVPLRADLLRGDWRALYLGWLAGIEDDELDEELREPPVPPELRKLSAPLTRLAEFIYLEDDLLAVARLKKRRPSSASPTDRRTVAELRAAAERRSQERQQAPRAATARHDAKGTWGLAEGVSLKRPSAP